MFAARAILTPGQADNEARFLRAYNSARKRRLGALLARINASSLVAIASRVHNNEVACTASAARHRNAGASIDWKSAARQMGGQNCHLDIKFADGTVWIARLRLDEPTLPPVEAQNQIFLSEVFTLRFLARTRLPVPKVFYHTLDCSVVGTPFMLIEKMPGRSLNWPKCSARQKTKVMEQLADVYLELDKHPLSATGSLASETGLVGPFAQERLFTTPSQSIGPFKTLGEAFTSISEHEICLINSGELNAQAVDNYLTHLWRMEQVPNLVVDIPETCFYLKHFDDKGDHILVDKHHNITGIIDWEWASADSKAVAFSSPCMMWPIAAFYQGSNRLSADEVEFAEMFQQRGREDMAQCVLQGRMYQRLLFFLGSPVPAQRDEFESLFQGLRGAMEGQGECTEPYAEWRKAALARASRDDPVFRRLIQRYHRP